MSEKFIKGRGAAFDPTNRFTLLSYSKENIDEEVEYKENPATQFFNDASKSILTESTSPDLGFMVTLNPYRGCEHGCIYCYARPTHEYLGFSAGVDFETKIFVKNDAASLLKSKLSSKNYDPHTIILSGITDPYQPIERKLKLTRSCIEVLTETKHPCAIITKNHLVTRDIDLLSQLAEINACRVTLSITTLDLELCAFMEPRTSRPEMRLEAVRKLSAAGIPTTVNVAPIIPGLTDHELPAILAAAASAGAISANYVVVRLPHAVKDLFSKWLEDHYPLKRDKVLNRIRSLRGGHLNDPRFNSRMKGEGEFATQIEKMFSIYARKEGLNKKHSSLSTEHFLKPGGQLKLF